MIEHESRADLATTFFPSSTPNLSLLDDRSRQTLEHILLRYRAEVDGRSDLEISEDGQSKPLRLELVLPTIHFHQVSMFISG